MKFLPGLIAKMAKKMKPHGKIGRRCARQTVIRQLKGQP